MAKELQDETNAKRTQREEMEKTNSEMKKKIEQQASVIATLESANSRILKEKKLHLKRSDMMRNVKLLNDALAAKKLPQEKHMVRYECIQPVINNCFPFLSYSCRFLNLECQRILDSRPLCTFLSELDHQLMQRKITKHPLCGKRSDYN